MASHSMDSSEGSEEKLSGLFGNAMSQFKEIENSKEATNSPESQERIKKCIKMFEDATRLVSMSGVFSCNESIEELSTESLQYLLLPVLLGTLNSKLTNKSRREVVSVCEIYFRDFLQRCKDYGVTNVDIPELKSSGDVDDKVTATQNPGARLTSMILSREEKLKKFRQQKELEEQLKTLKEAMDLPNIDESTKRDYFITLIQSYVNQSLDELNSIEMEKPLIDFMEKQKQSGSRDEPRKPKREVTPLKPIIITKDQIQKAVYGAGYPSLPVLTVEEFYEQRVKEGSFPGPQKTKKAPTSLQEMTEADMEEVYNRQDEEKEKKLEDDDPEELARARNMDEYKDDHRRGWGNRHNRS